MLYSLVISIGGILLMMGLWVLIQAAWGRLFPGVARQGDVLAGRLGCGNCTDQDDCDLKNAVHRHTDEACRRSADTTFSKAD